MGQFHGFIRIFFTAHVCDDESRGTSHLWRQEWQGLFPLMAKGQQTLVSSSFSVLKDIVQRKLRQIKVVLING
jgi:hypothetical protein